VEVKEPPVVSVSKEVHNVRDNLVSSEKATSVDIRVELIDRELVSLHN